MFFLVLTAGILLLILLITWAKLNAFLAFLIVCVTVGLVQGMDIASVSASIQKGIGDLLGSLVIIVCLGAMLGKLVADSGAATRISSGLIQLFGKRYLQWALLITSFIVGIPLFYNVGFVLLVPLMISIATRYKLPVIWLTLPALSALSVTHGYLPPHPSPVALIQQYKADIGVTLFYGFLIAVPAILIAGPLFAVTLKGYNNKPLKVFTAKEIPADQLPGMFNSITAAFLPVVLITLDSVVTFAIHKNNGFTSFVHTIGNPPIAMLLSVLLATYTLGIKRGKKMTEVMATLGEAAKDVVMILLVIGGAGALKQILTDSGISQQIVQNLGSLNVHPLLLAWGISAIIRICLGSATVAGLTAAGIVAPLIITSGVDANLMVLATGAGSLMFSHVNDAGFWLYKEYFNLSVKQTLKTWSVMETIVSIVGLIGVFVLNYFISK